MPPILSLSNNLSASRPSLDAAPPTPTSTAGAITGINFSSSTTANTVIGNFALSIQSTGGKVLSASLQNGKTVAGGALMNGTGTLTVTRAAQDGHSAATSTATCFIYYSTAPNDSTETYFVAPTQNASGLAYGNATEFDLATSFAADISAQAPFSSVSATLQIGAFAFNVTVDGVLHNCTASNTVTSNNAIVIPA